MSDGQIKTPVRGQAQPGQDDRSATAAGISSHRERDDGYRSVIVRLAPRWRVILCKDHAQRIVQHRTADPLHRGVWRGQSYYRNRDSLIAACARLEPLSGPSVTAILSVLPDRIGGQSMKEQSSAATAIDKARAMIDGGWSVVPLRPNQNGPPALVGLNAHSPSFFKSGASAFTVLRAWPPGCRSSASRLNAGMPVNGRPSKTS